MISSALRLKLKAQLLQKRNENYQKQTNKWTKTKIKQKTIAVPFSESWHSKSLKRCGSTSL